MQPNLSHLIGHVGGRGTSACNLVGPARAGRDWVRVGWLAGASVSYWQPWAPNSWTLYIYIGLVYLASQVLNIIQHPRWRAAPPPAA